MGWGEQATHTLALLMGDKVGGWGERVGAGVAPCLRVWPAPPPLPPHTQTHTRARTPSPPPGQVGPRRELIERHGSRLALEDLDI